MNARATARIMLVDDDPFMLKLLARMLARLGYWQVDCHASARLAIDQLTSSGKACDLIFLDIHMPGMDGVEFIRRLADCHYAGGVVLVSGETNRILESVGKLVDAHHLNSLGQLRKPVKPAELARVMSRLQARSASAAPQDLARRSYPVEQLRAAIHGGELVNHYQPKVSLATREVVGVECLVRWQHPQDGLVSPDEFIAMASAHGLITDLTKVVLAGAMAQAKSWLRAGHDLSVAVNVSMDDLASLDFPDVAAAMARAAGIDPRMITLEVTEGQMMRKLSTVLEVITRLELKRFRLSVDDFGTGHSSLAQLRDLPFNELKIDKGFVQGATSEEARRAICTASVRMAHELDIQVVGEGIENQCDWDFLQRLGCDIGQGYFIARPMPGEDIPEWIDAWVDRRHGTATLNG
jgi:EAL domain-containing protein (putative c-di-GMP-specific phosphodiesterase class I)/FixJ family two-component response regulator